MEMLDDVLDLRIHLKSKPVIARFLQQYNLCCGLVDWNFYDPKWLL